MPMFDPLKFTTAQKEFLATLVVDTELSPRAIHALLANSASCMADAYILTRQEILRTPNTGRVTLAEIEAEFAKVGLSLKDYRLELWQETEDRLALLLMVAGELIGDLVKKNGAEHGERILNEAILYIERTVREEVTKIIERTVRAEAVALTPGGATPGAS